MTDSNFHLPAETHIANAHLQVSNLERALHFYSGLIGFKEIHHDGESAGGYHHHLGVNIWAGQGAPPPPPEAVGLASFSFALPNHQAIERLKERFSEAGIAFEKNNDPSSDSSSFAVHDFDGNLVALMAKRE